MDASDKLGVGELRPHFVASALERIVRTRNPNRIANHFGWLIAQDERFEEAIREALNDCHDGCGPSAAHRVRIAVGELILKYPEC
jgi:hypothetical protein